jgi:hypothetical protein
VASVQQSHIATTAYPQVLAVHSSRRALEEGSSFKVALSMGESCNNSGQKKKTSLQIKIL